MQGRIHRTMQQTQGVCVGGGTLQFNIYVGLDHFRRVKTLIFNIFEGGRGVRNMNNVWGMKFLWILWSVQISPIFGDISMLFMVFS